jgi:hypothetical protein
MIEESHISGGNIWENIQRKRKKQIFANYQTMPDMPLQIARRNLQKKGRRSRWLEQQFEAEK